MAAVRFPTVHVAYCACTSATPAVTAAPTRPASVTGPPDSAAAKPGSCPVTACPAAMTASTASAAS